MAHEGKRHLNGVLAFVGIAVELQAHVRLTQVGQQGRIDGDWSQRRVPSLGGIDGRPFQGAAVHGAEKDERRRGGRRQREEHPRRGAAREEPAGVGRDRGASAGKGRRRETAHVFLDRRG